MGMSLLPDSSRRRSRWWRLMASASCRECCASTVACWRSRGSRSGLTARPAVVLSAGPRASVSGMAGVSAIVGSRICQATSRGSRGRAGRSADACAGLVRQQQADGSRDRRRDAVAVTSVGIIPRPSRVRIPAASSNDIFWPYRVIARWRAARLLRSTSQPGVTVATGVGKAAGHIR